MRKILFLTAAISLCVHIAIAQQSSDINQYRRSSLYTIIIDDDGLMDKSKASVIKKTFTETPLPEKFNDHNLAIRIVNPKDFPVTSSEIAAVKDTKPEGEDGISKEEKDKALMLPATLMKFFNEKHIAQDLIAKWYNRSGSFNSSTSSFFDMELIKQRGLYDASEFDKQMADKSTRGIAMLADAGEDLINNTFVVAIHFNYINKEEVGKAVASTTAKASNALSGTKLGGIARVANKAVKTTADVAAKGYTVKATAFLFQLDWTDEVNATFYQDYYNAEDLSEFYESGKFRLKYVGSVSDWSDVQSTAFSKKPEEELVRRAAIRSIDQSIAKLQKKYEPFRIKTPLFTTDPETAHIGMKEGVEEGDRFEVLEKNMDPESGKVTYKRVGTIKAEKGKVWDNRYAADEEQAEDAAQGEGSVQTINATTFSGGNKNMYPGLLIRQIN